VVHANYDSDFFGRITDGARSSARRTVPLVLELIPARSVVDVGCGGGTWLSVFAENGIEDYLGVDGDYVDRSQLDIPMERFRGHDLEQPLVLDRTFDLAVSLEVAEHLDPPVASTFVTWLVKLAPVVLFSAAIPGQDGDHHVNEQWPAYWGRLFAEQGFVGIDCIRPLIWDDPQVEYWYAQNAILYVRESEVLGYPKLPPKAAWNAGLARALVHPTHHDKMLSQPRHPSQGGDQPPPRGQASNPAPAAAPVNLRGSSVRDA